MKHSTNCLCYNCPELLNGTFDCACDDGPTYTKYCLECLRRFGCDVTKNPWHYKPDDIVPWCGECIHRSVCSIRYLANDPKLLVKKIKCDYFEKDVDLMKNIKKALDEIDKEG